MYKADNFIDLFFPVYELSLSSSFHSSSDTDNYLTSNLNNGISFDPCSNPSYQPSINSNTGLVINVEYNHFHFTWLLNDPLLEHIQRLLNVLIFCTYPTINKKGVWVVNERVLVSHKDNSHGEHTLIHADCKEEDPPP